MRYLGDILIKHVEETFVRDFLMRLFDEPFYETFL